MELFDLKGKNALITGSTRGIGKAVAFGLASRGANIMLHCSRSEQKAQEVLDELLSKYDVKASYCVANLAEDDACTKLYEKTVNDLGDIDIFISNASMQYERKWEEATLDEFMYEMKVNVWPTLEICQKIVPKMKEKKWGRIITVGSVQQYKPNPYTVTYAAGKMGLVSFVMSLASDLAPYGITVNNIAPGVTITPRLDTYLENTTKEEIELLTKQIPMRRFAEAEECVGPVLLLCSNEGSYITAADVTIDGGMRL